MILEKSNYKASTEKTMDLRAHHLYTLAKLESFQAHKLESRKKLIKKIKSTKLYLLGYGNTKNFADHLVDSLLAILKNEVSAVRIVSTHDEICKKCAEQGNNHCKVGGIKWSKSFLQLLDETLIKNTNDLLQINGSYPPNYLLENLPLIRKAIRKTLLEIPGLWRKDRKK